MVLNTIWRRSSCRIRPKTVIISKKLSQMFRAEFASKVVKILRERTISYCINKQLVGNTDGLQLITTMEYRLAKCLN